MTSEDSVLLPGSKSKIPLTPEFKARFILDGLLGRGHMGLVIKATDLKAARAVALKFFTGAENDRMRQRFLLEGQLLQSIRHPNIVSLFEIGNVGRNLYMVFEYLGGGTLKDVMRAHMRLPPPEAVPIILDCLRGLGACHGYGVIHRDVKPENILFDSERRAKLADLGVAKDTAKALDLTQTGAIVGTPAYLSPEQATGDNVSVRSDLYSAGVVLYEMLTGHPPFVSENLYQILTMHCTTPPVSVRTLIAGVPQALSDLVDHLLAKNPDDRPESADAVIRRLEELELATTDRSLALSNYSCIRLPHRTELPPVPFESAPVARMLVADAELEPSGSYHRPSGTERRPPPPPVPATPAATAPGEAPRESELLRALGRSRRRRPAPATGTDVGRTLGHSMPRTRGAFTAAALSADGLVLATGTEDGIVRLWDALHGELLLELKSERLQSADSLAISADGRQLAAGGRHDQKGLVLLYDAVHDSAGEAEFDAPIRAVAFNAAADCITVRARDGRLIASGCRHREDREIVPAEPTPMPRFALAANATVIAIAGQDQIEIWDLSTFEKRTDVTVAPDGCAGVACSPDGKWVAVGLTSGGVKLFGASRVLRAADLCKGPASQLSVAANGTVAVHQPQGDTILWEPESDKRSMALWSSPPFVFAGDGKLFASVVDHGDIYIKDVGTMRRKSRIPGPRVIARISISPDGERVAALALDQRLAVWELDSGRELYSSRYPHRGSLPWSGTCCFLSDGRTLACPTADFTIRLIDVTTGQPCGQLDGHEYVIQGLALSPDGRTLASASLDRSVRLWDATRMKAKRELKLQGAAFESVFFSPQGDLVAAVDAGSRVCLWECRTGRLAAALQGPPGCFRDSGFSPDGQHLVAVEAGAILLVEIPGSPELRADEPIPEYRGTVFGREGEVAGVGPARTTMVYRAPGDASVTALAFSPDCTRVAIGLSDGLVQVGSFEHGRLSLTPGFRSAHESLALTRQQLVCGGAQLTVHRLKPD